MTPGKEEDSSLSATVPTAPSNGYTYPTQNTCPYSCVQKEQVGEGTYVRYSAQSSEYKYLVCIWCVYMCTSHGVMLRNNLSTNTMRHSATHMRKSFFGKKSAVTGGIQTV